MTTIERLIELTKNNKITWIPSQDGIYKTFNNDICIRLEFDGYAGFALKVDTVYICVTADGSYDSDKLVILYGEVLPRLKHTPEERFFDGLM